MINNNQDESDIVDLLSQSQRLQEGFDNSSQINEQKASIQSSGNKIAPDSELVNDEEGDDKDDGEKKATSKIGEVIAAPNEEEKVSNDVLEKEKEDRRKELELVAKIHEDNKIDFNDPENFNAHRFLKGDTYTFN